MARHLPFRYRQDPETDVMIAVCLLTCDRFRYTAVTLSSFARFNDCGRFVLLHADDASRDSAVPDLAHAYGFRTIAQSTRRLGWLAMRLKLFHAAAAKKGVEWVLFLENDIEWVREFPWALFDFLRAYSQIYCLRLYGAFKDRDLAEPCMLYHKADRRKPVKWKPIKRAPEPAQVSHIHWSAQPSVTRLPDLLALHELRRESPRQTARVVENVTYHIGRQRTTALPLKGGAHG